MLDHTLDELLIWNHIYAAIGTAAKPRIVHIPSDFVARHHEPARGGLLGDKAHAVIFDNTKIKLLRPRICGADSVLRWRPARQKFSAEGNQLLDDVLAAYEKGSHS